MSGIHFNDPSSLMSFSLQNALVSTKRSQSSDQDAFPNECVHAMKPLSFDDGNVDLVAHNATVTVHKGVLCAVTDVFKTIWNERPDPENGRMTVWLTDSKFDLLTYTNAIYDINRRVFIFVFVYLY